MHLLFVGHLQDEGIVSGELSLIIEMEKGHLERLFLKESQEQGVHFDAPQSVSKIVCPFILATNYSRILSNSI